MKRHRLVERQHPIFSPIGFTSTFILVAGLSLYIWFTGGRAFNPGNLSALNARGEEVGGFLSHADFQDACTQCHAPFKGIEAARCQNCHTNVADQQRRGAGLHSRFANVTRCADCHQEHKGENFDQAAAAEHDFDHSVTGFSLAEHELDYAGAPLTCTICHSPQSAVAMDAAICQDCHKQEKPDFMQTHLADFGADCLACHDGLDTLADFTLEDHAQSFALTGLHAETTCAGCHNAGIFEGTPADCVSCHAEPDQHRGLFGVDCAACHTPDGWAPATLDPAIFDHARDTGFSLARHVANYDQTPFTCDGCHTGPQFAFAVADCAACHGEADAAFMTAHVAQFGDDCLSCHDGADRMSNFDHAAVWPLEGQHAAADCVGCHQAQVFAGTPRDCVACHAEPALHAGLFGLDCAACHTPAAWQPARLMHHTFPLTHGDEGEIPCATCHTTTFDRYTCDNCHERAEMVNKHQDEGISALELEQCARCHPTGTEEEAEGG